MLGMAKPILVVTSRYTRKIEDRIDRDYNARRTRTSFLISRQKLLSAAEGADALFITPADRLDSGFFQNVSPTVKIIAMYSMGSIAAYRQRHDRNPYSDGHAGPGQCGRGSEWRAADPRPALVAVRSSDNVKY